MGGPNGITRVLLSGRLESLESRVGDGMVEAEGGVYVYGVEGEMERGRRRGKSWGVEREKYKDAILMSLNIEEGAISQGTWAASSSWKRQGNGFAPHTPRRNTAS